MLHHDNNTHRHVGSEPVQLAPNVLRLVAGGSPTLPLPPPAARNPDPVACARAFI
jgi:hypothetical protein